MKKRSKGDLEAELYLISAMLFALGELIKCQDREPSTDEEKFNFGMGSILARLSSNVEEIRILFENK